MHSEKEKSNLIIQIEQKLVLQFLNNNTSGNLCFMNNNDELQNEFKQSFTEIDFLNFLKNFHRQNVEIPEERITFWDLVEKGKEI